MLYFDIVIEERTTDADLDPWCSDAAKYAAMAVSGAIWEQGSSSQLRLEFWKWWLLEAIPQAHNAAATLAFSEVA